MSTKLHNVPEQTEETQEFRRARNGRRAWIGLWGGMAGIVLAVPILLGWVGSAYEITKTPTQIKELQTRQDDLDKEQTALKASTEASLREIRESQVRIERALRITPPKNENP